jgi:hypothetical protein
MMRFTGRRSKAAGGSATAVVAVGALVLWGAGGATLWVPKTYATWADDLRGAGRLHPVSGGWKAG